MPLISDTIPNLTGGVSQQADNLRYSNTAQACENAMLSPVTGLQKRQAAEWLGELHPYGTTNDLALDDKAAVHWINRDATEHYALIVDSNGLRAFDADTGQALQVVIPDEVTTYLTSNGEGGTAADFQDSLRFVTVADTTFVANRNVTVKGSVDADFEPHHFAAYPQLSYDKARGGSGVVDSGGTSRERGDATVTQSTFEFPNATYQENEARWAVISAQADANNGLHVYHDNSRNYDYTSDFKIRIESSFNPVNAGNTYIIVESGKLEHRDRPVADNILRGLQMQNAQGWETYSVASLLTSRHVSTRNSAGTLVNYVTTSDSPVRFSFATVGSQTYGPNGSKTSLFGRTISHDLKIENGFLKISDDNGSTYRDLRINDHPTAKLYSTAALRPWAGTDASNTADIDFTNVDTSQSNSASTTSNTASWPGGSRSGNNQQLFSTAFMPNSSAQLSLLNDVVWVLNHFVANDTTSNSNSAYVADVFAPSSVAPLDANSVTFSTIVSGSDSNQVATFQDLPGLNGSPVITGGSVYEVGGTAQGDGRYYVIVFDEGAADQRYIETYKTPYILNETTLPIKVRREFDQNGNPQFVASLHKYAPRVVGDADTNALPTFVDNKINDIFVHAGRLGFLSGESLILSSTDEFGVSANFFRATVAQLLDNDRIDLDASTGDVANLSFAVPFANTLLLMSERAQYRLVANGALTPATSIIQQTGAHATPMQARPQRVGKSVFSAVSDVVRTTVREFRADIDTDILESNEVTTQVPKFLPPNVFKLAHSAKKNILLALSHTNTNSLFVYNYYDANNQRLQSAWSSWKFEDDTKIVNIEVIDDYLHLVCSVSVPDYVGALEAANSTGTAFGQTQTRAHVLRIPLNEITEVTSANFPVLADFRATRSQCVSVEGERQQGTEGVSQQNATNFRYPSSTLATGNLLAIPLPSGLDFSIVELPYKTTATDVRTVFTDSAAYGISPPLIAAVNHEIDSGSSQAALAAATATFIASPTQANADAINAIVVNTQNTKAIVIGRLDGIFLTPDDQVLNNITTAVVPDFVIGRAYTMSYEQSPIFYKSGEANVGKTDSRLQLRYCTVTCDETSSFDVLVTTDGRRERQYDYEAFKPGVADFQLGERRFASENFRFPVFAQNQKCKIVFRNATVLPSTLTSLEWQGFVSPKAVAVR